MSLPLGWSAAHAALQPAARPPAPLKNADGDIDWKAVQAEFQTDDGWAYFNAATLGLMPRTSIGRIAEKMASLARGHYRDFSDPLLLLSQIIGARPEDIVLTRNTTEGINIVAGGLRMRRRDEVILTSHEHVGNALPWLNRQRRDGIRIRVFEPGQTAAETMERIAALTTRRTRVIAVPHVTCTIGTVLPIDEIAAFARERGILTFFDGAHGAVNAPLDMAATACDFYAGCGHKWLCGPAGTGFLNVKPGRLEELELLMTGAEPGTTWTLTPEEQQMGPLAPGPGRFRYGTQNMAISEGLEASLQFWQQIGLDAVRKRGIALADQLRAGLMEMPHVEVLTPSEPASRSMILGFKIRDQRDIRKLFQLANQQKLRIRIVPEAGLDSLRISCHAFNDEAQIERLTAFVRSLDKV